MLIRNIDDYNDVFDVDNAVDGCDYNNSFQETFLFWKWNF